MHTLFGLVKADRKKILFNPSCLSSDALRQSAESAFSNST